GDVLHALGRVLEEDLDQLDEESGLVLAAELAESLDDRGIDGCFGMHEGVVIRVGPAPRARALRSRGRCRKSTPTSGFGDPGLSSARGKQGETRGPAGGSPRARSTGSSRAPGGPRGGSPGTARRARGSGGPRPRGPSAAAPSRGRGRAPGSRGGASPPRPRPRGGTPRSRRRGGRACSGRGSRGSRAAGTRASSTSRPGGRRARRPR